MKLLSASQFSRNRLTDIKVLHWSSQARIRLTHFEPVSVAKARLMLYGPLLQRSLQPSREAYPGDNGYVDDYQSERNISYLGLEQRPNCSWVAHSSTSPVLRGPPIITYHG